MLFVFLMPLPFPPTPTQYWKGLSLAKSSYLLKSVAFGQSGQLRVDFLGNFLKRVNREKYSPLGP